jgi:hypothetical protein
MSDITYGIKLESARFNPDNVPAWRWHQYFEEVFDALRVYEDADRDGRLVVLPCKVGDAVYSIHTLPNSGKKVIAEVQTDLFFIVLSVCEGRFGKTVFLTRAEADAALDGRE